MRLKPFRASLRNFFKICNNINYFSLHVFQALYGAVEKSQGNVAAPMYYAKLIWFFCLTRSNGEAYITFVGL